MKSSMLLRQNVKHLYLNEYTSRFLYIYQLFQGPVQLSLIRYGLQYA